MFFFFLREVWKLVNFIVSILLHLTPFRLLRLLLLITRVTGFGFTIEMIWLLEGKNLILICDTGARRANYI